MKRLLAKSLAAVALLTVLTGVGAPAAQAQPTCGPGFVRVSVGGPGTGAPMVLCVVVLATTTTACPPGRVRVVVPPTGPAAGQVVCATILAS